MLRANPNDRPTMSEVSRALGAVAAGQAAGPVLGPSTGPTPMIEPGPPTPPRPEIDPSTVRTWQPQVHHAPPTPPRPYPVRPQGRPGGPPGYPGQSTAPAWRKRLLTALAIVVAALIGILVANAFVDTSGDSTSLSSLGTNTPDPSMADQPLPSALPTTTQFTQVSMATTTTDAPPAGMNETPTFPAETVVLHTYFGLLPGQPAQAFQLLTPKEQNASGGLAVYQQTWSTVQGVMLGATVPHGEGHIRAKVRVQPQNGQGTDSTYDFTFVEQNGSVLIDNVTVVGKSGRHG
jgi:hypothetical protein